MEKLSAYFFSGYHFQQPTTWFKRLLYLFLIGECCYYLAYFDLFFGAHSIVFVDPKSIGPFKSFAYLLYNSGSASLAGIFICAVIALSVLNLFRPVFRFFPDLLLWLLMINLHNRIYPSLTAGDNLLNQFLFFNCFLSAHFIKKESWQWQLRICTHNLACVGIVVQLCLLYFLSALAKLGDATWRDGTAIMAVSQIRHFSLFSFLTYRPGSKFLYLFLNYAVLFYQLFFPALIWFRTFKKPLLVAGILMHLYIAFVMGLVSFGLVMLLGYLFLWPFKTAD